jgi:thiol-disulfide isomerase/thioredoxin
MVDWGVKFESALGYNEFLSQYGADAHRGRWQAMFDRIQLTDSQQSLLGSFTREMRVLCMAGAWCGDCVEQCPILEHFAQATDGIHLRFVDRDADDEVKQNLTVCGGARVPQVIFLSEDNQFVSHFGDRTLPKYRQMAADQLGDSCPTGLGPPADSLTSAVVQAWLDEFERVHLILRTSPRLRQIHGD